MTQYLVYVGVFKRVKNDVFDGWIGHVPSLDITETVMDETLGGCEYKLQSFVRKYGKPGGEKGTTIEYQSIFPDSIVTTMYVEI